MLNLPTFLISNPSRLKHTSFHPDSGFEVKLLNGFEIQTCEKYNHDASPSLKRKRRDQRGRASRLHLGRFYARTAARSCTALSLVSAASSTFAPRSRKLLLTINISQCAMPSYRRLKLSSQLRCIVRKLKFIASLMNKQLSKRIAVNTDGPLNVCTISTSICRCDAQEKSLVGETP